MNLPDYKHKLDLWHESNLTLAITTIILVSIYTGMLVKICYGSRYRLLLIIVGMLLVNNLGYTLSGYSFCKLIETMETLNLSDWRKSLAEMRYWARFASITQSIGFLFFGEAHWILACFYFKIAKNMPRVVNGDVHKVRSYNTMFWVGIFLNALFPFL